jgi:hypothetical protein
MQTTFRARWAVRCVLYDYNFAPTILGVFRISFEQRSWIVMMPPYLPAECMWKLSRTGPTDQCFHGTGPIRAVTL